MDHSLVNPNQLRHYGTKVPGNPVSDRALSIITENNDFCMELVMAGTVVYADTTVPSITSSMQKSLFSVMIDSSLSETGLS